MEKYVSNKRMNRKLIMVLLLLSVKLAVYAQVKITGEINDINGKRVSGVNTLLMLSKDSSQIQGTVSDESGKFELRNVLPEEYIIKFQSIGYKQQYKHIKVDRNYPENIIVELKENINNLKEITVQQQKLLIKQDGNKLIFDAKNNASNKGGSALEMLQTIPSVSINRQNNSIYINGKEGVMLMLNGKLSRLPATAIVEMLNGMSSDQISKVEIMSNPPAKYTSEGNGGIINIVTKSGENQETSASVNLYTGYGVGAKAGLSTSIVYNKNKTSVYGEYSYAYNNTYQFFTNKRETIFNGKLNSFFNQSTRQPNITNHNVRIGVDYKVSNKIVVGLLTSGYINNWRMNAVNITDMIRSSTDSTSNITTKTVEQNLWSNISYNSYLNYKIDSTSKINIDLDYLYYKNNNPTTYKYEYAGLDTYETNNTRVNKSTPVKMLVSQIDYTKNFKKKLALEAGYNSSIAQFNNDVEVQNEIQENWKIDKSLSNNYNLREYIHSVYASVNKEFNKIKFMGGIRYEHTFTQLGNQENENIILRKYGNLFPNLSISRTINENSSIQLTYGRRITRPSYTDLAPFIIYYDPYTISTGNIKLQPAIGDAFNVDYSYKKIFISGQYSYDNNAIARFQPQIIEGQNQQLIASINLNYRKTISLLLSVPTVINKVWEMQNTITGVFQQIETSHLSNPVKLSQFSCRYNYNQKFKFQPGFTFEISGFYQSPFLLGISKHKSQGTINLGLTKKLNNSTIGLIYSDPFKMNFDREYVLDPQENLNIDIVYKYEFQVLKLTYSYNFGKNLYNFTNRKTGSENIRKRIE